MKMLIKLQESQILLQRTNEKEILRERFIPSELKQTIINDVRLKEENIDYFKINIITI